MKAKKRILVPMSYIVFLEYFWYLVLLVFDRIGIWSYWYSILLVLDLIGIRSYWYLVVLVFGLIGIWSYWEDFQKIDISFMV